MSQKQFFLIVDTETTLDDLVADFGYVVADREGRIYQQGGVLINGIYNDKDNHPLFYDANANDIWAKRNLGARYENYKTLLQTGNRVLASVDYINKTLAQIKTAYNPILTAYNLAFDLDKMKKTDIFGGLFANTFCLWSASADKICKTKAYKNYILSRHAFNPPTGSQNMTYKTDAENVARYVLDNPNLPDEPHTSLEDVVFYELPILARLLKNNSVTKLTDCKKYNWRDFQVKNHFKV